MAQVAKGITLSIGGDTIGDVVSISTPTQTRESVDTTTVSDGSSMWRTKLPGLIDAGEATFTVEYDGSSGGEAKTLQDKLVASFTPGSAGAEVVITFNDGDTTNSSFTADGFVSSLSVPSIEAGARITQDVTVTFTGSVSFAVHN